MIEVSLSVLLLLYLAATTSIVFGLWAIQHYYGRRKEPFVQEKNLRICEFCRHTYLAECAQAVTQCPQCKSFNKV